jgi:DNA-binding response OmpR family regulator
MQIDNLSWFPGHMTKTKRMISAEIKNMDAVCEIVDARSHGVIDGYVVKPVSASTLLAQIRSSRKE